MKDRILKVRKDNNLTQDSFAEKLNLSKNFVWMLEKGERIPSDRTISDICREFGVNEDWLRTGAGEPTVKRTRNQEIQKFANDTMDDIDESFRKRFVQALSRLNETEWEVLEKIVNEMSKGG